MVTGENKTSAFEGKNAGEFFIVDNTSEHWKVLDYVREWCDLSESVDIATGYFEVGAFLALKNEWQKVDKFRVLIGSETSRQTIDAIRQASAVLEAAIEKDVQVDPFLEGLEAVVEAIRTGKIEIRVYKKRKFHAKAYITHGRLSVVGSAALVGSSNFTPPGLTRNVELNVRFTGVEVRELQEWFEGFWEDAEDISAELLSIIENHTREFTPFEIYAKALQAISEGVEQTDSEWEQHNSSLYPKLAPYQREAYHGLKQRAAQWNGAFLTDGVGLGKTFVGLMLAEYYAVKERKNVLILSTKTGQDAVWAPELENHLPDLSGVFAKIHLMAHTDLSKKDALEEIKMLSDRVDVVIIDEAHNFRNHGPKGSDEQGPKSRWWRLQEICKGKTVFLLTATPINNSLFDFAHQCEIFTGLNDGHFGSIGIPSLKNYISNLENTFFAAVDGNRGKREAAIDISDFESLMSTDKLLESLIVQNSRDYAVKSAIAIGDKSVKFPKPTMPRAIPYKFTDAYSGLLDELEIAFGKDAPLFVLPMYYPLAYAKSKNLDANIENRQKQIVGLIRTIFLKRFESSIAAFAGSCVDLARKIVEWLLANAHTIPEFREKASAWHVDHSEVISEIHTLFRPGVEIDELDFNDDEEAGLFDNFEVNGELLTPADFDLNPMFEAALDDLEQLGKLLRHAVAVGHIHDDKFKQLLKLLTETSEPRTSENDELVFTKSFRTEKVLVFTEFADTARYLEQRLKDSGVGDLDRLDGSRKNNRLEMIKRFAPFYNRVASEERKKLKKLRVLVTTDVLSEGVNLQDASQVVNYDIHWNPVRLMQRIGRIDRRLNIEIEADLVNEHPELVASRGAISIRNFLPPADLNRLLSLYSRVQNRVLLISNTLGIPGGRLLDEADLLNDVKVFNSFIKDYVGEISPLEVLRLKYLELIKSDETLEARLSKLPNGAFSSKSSSNAGIFRCSIEPIRVTDVGSGESHWTLEGGYIKWEFESSGEHRDGSLSKINDYISCTPEEMRLTVSDVPTVKATLKSLGDARLEDLRKKSGLPLDAPSPKTIVWMECQ